ncbi:DUF1127 domain-containing protein [Pelagibius marinus]|uniref:DUF1127 domain-containing protein n=1 Tax=Pelagibius marinus TaxID=2762760 RepID=UPI001D04991D|nr:DUF1127 domain-containing protein [Pelagibius marinus]
MMRTDLPAARLPGRGQDGAPGFFVGFARRLVLGTVNLLMVWQQRLEDRACLEAMSEARLRDIGLTRAEARREAEKPFWRA